MATQNIKTFDGNGNLISEETVEIPAVIHNARIKAQLAELDSKSIRALREGNLVRIDELEDQAAALRAQLV